MASKSKKSAVIVAVCAVAAVIFFIAIIVVVSVSQSDDDLYGDKQVDPYMTIRRMDVDIVWKNDRSCEIVQDISVSFHNHNGYFEPTHGIFIDIPINSGEKVRSLSVDVSPNRDVVLGYESFRNIVRARVGDEDTLFYAGDELRCVVKYDYITPEHKAGSDILALMAIGKGWTCPIENATVTVTYPKAPDMTAVDREYGIWVAGQKADESGQWSADGKTLTVRVDSLDAYEGVEIAYKLPRGTLVGYGDTEFLWTLIIGLVLLAAAVVFQLFVAKNKPLTPIVDFYPPRVGGGNDDYFDPPDKYKLKVRRMLPVQMGKIIDDSCSATDVTSLVFYWASNGFLSIDERDDGTYLVKEHDIDQITDYEAKLFNRLFAGARIGANGKPEVSVQSLSGSFGQNINECRSAVNAEYRGKFYKGGFNALSIVMSVLCGLYGALIAVLSTLRVGAFMFNFVGLFTIVPVVLSAVAGAIISKQYFKLSAAKRNALIIGYGVITVALVFATAFAIPLDVMGWAERIIYVVALGASSALAPFLTVRKSEYNEQLNSILGFRNFLRDAEKDRLETMLADNPQYYYDILPYANVLGVSDIWADKFKGMAIEPPTYYSSTRPDLFDIFVISRLTRSVGQKLTYVPPKVNMGSFSSGGHGGGHGGGFSGGSFGGGGGGRW